MSAWVTSSAVECLGWTLLHFVWQGCAIAAALAICLRFLRARTANVRYIAACVALLCMGLAPVLTLAYSLRQSQPAIVTEARPVSSSAPATVFSAPASHELRLFTIKKDYVVVDRPQLLKNLLPWIVLGWSCGVLLFSSRLLVDWMRIQALRKKGLIELDEIFRSKCVGLARRLGIFKPVCFVQSVLVEVPTIIGWLRPVILLPASCLTGLSPAQLESILAHELAHIRRHDYLVNLLQSIVETLLFYHPAVWWVSRRVREERENCCDDLAVKICGDPVVYARALATLEELRPAPAQLALAAGGAPLLQRIQRLLRQTPGSTSRPGWPVVGMIILLLLGVLTIGLRGNRSVAAEETTTSAAPPAVVDKDKLAAKGYIPWHASPEVVLKFTLVGISSNAMERLGGLHGSVFPESTERMKNTASFTGILSNQQFRQALKKLEQSQGVDIFNARSIVTESGYQGQVQVESLQNSTNAQTSNAQPGPKASSSRLVIDELARASTDGHFIELTVTYPRMEKIEKDISRPPTILDLSRSAPKRITVSSVVEDTQTLVMGKVDSQYFNDETNHGFSFLHTNFLLFVTATLINHDGKRFNTQEPSAPSGIITPPPPASAPLVTNGFEHPHSEPANPQTSDSSTARPDEARRTPHIAQEGRRAIISKLDKIRIASVKYHHLPLTEVLHDLDILAKKSDPDGTGIRFFIDKYDSAQALRSGIDPDTGLPISTSAPIDKDMDPDKVMVNIDPALTDVRLADLLDAITCTAEKPIKYSILDYAVVFSQKLPLPVPLEIRTFHLNTDRREKFEKIVGKPSSEISNNEPGLMAFLTNLGLDFDKSNPANIGKAVFFNSHRGTLTVRSTSHDLDVLENGLALLGWKASKATTLGAPSATGQSGNGREAILTKLNQIQVDSVLYENVPLPDVVRSLSELSIKGDPKHSGVNFFIDPKFRGASLRRQIDRIIGSQNALLPPDMNAVIVKIRPGLVSVRLSDLLEAIVKCTDKPIEYSVLNYAVVFSPKVLETSNDASAKTNGNGMLSPPARRISPDRDKNGVANQSSSHGERQVKFEVKFAEVDEKISHTRDWEWLFKGIEMKNATNATFSFTEKQTNSAAPNMATFTTNSGSLPIAGLLTGSEYKKVINKLEQQAGAALLTMPPATTLSGQAVQLSAMGEQNVFIMKTNSVQTQKFPTGPQIDLNSRLLADGKSLEISATPSVTEIEEPFPTNFVTIHGAGPAFRIRQMTGSAAIQSGQTLVLGVHTEYGSGVKDKVPLLGDLPYIGALFRSEQVLKTEKNLLVFVTPTLIADNGSPNNK